MTVESPLVPKKGPGVQDVPEWVLMMRRDCKRLLGEMAREVGPRDLLVTELDELLQKAWKEGWKTGVGQR